MYVKEIAGSWRLKSFKIESPEGQIRDWGVDAHGLLIYTLDGFMSVSINRKVQEKSDNRFENLFDSILFYSGTYKIEEDLIRNKVTEASNPDRIGKEMIRYAKSEGNTITLTTPKEAFGTAILVWQRS